MFDQIQKDLVKILGEQVPEDLVLMGTSLRRRGSVRDVEDVPDEQETVVDKIDLAIGQLGLVHDPAEPISDDPGGPGVPEHLLGLAQAVRELVQGLTSSLRLLETFHWTETFHGNCQIYKKSNYGIKNLKAENIYNSLLFNY